MKNIILILVVLFSNFIVAQNTVPSIYTNIKFEEGQGYVLQTDSQTISEINNVSFYTLSNLIGSPRGIDTGFSFNFNDSTFEGLLYYGFVNINDGRYSQPVYFKRYSEIKEGLAQIDMTVLVDHYDMIGWAKSHKGILAYRVVDDKGNILYDGKLSFVKKEKFEVVPSVTEGPMLSILTDSSVTIRYKTNLKAKSYVKIGGQTFEDTKLTEVHELLIPHLESDTKYEYELICGGNTYKYSFRTAPKKGRRTAFTFAYASDSRGGQGGGERNIRGTNAYILKKVMALASQQKSVFVQFTGDLINGYSLDISNSQLEYANFKHVISPFTTYTPFYVGIGNHESVGRLFPVKNQYGVFVDRFPFDTESMEAVFAKEFTHPLNGPISEDGEEYDPDKKKKDFPSYQENVYYYVYDNIAVVVLNTEYLYTPSLAYSPQTSGGLHGYLMDGQLKWLANTLSTFEKDTDIDYVFITHHTPIFPNGGHARNSMWYNGDNHYRSIIAGQGMKRGIIEQRDKYLDLIVNKSSKVIAVLTGDEHNYCKTLINADIKMYPTDWTLPKLKLKRSIYQINNGACGAPYYAQEETPWSEFTSGFSTQNALVLIDVDGRKVKVRVLNPDTLEEIEQFDLKK